MYLCIRKGVFELNICFMIRRIALFIFSLMVLCEFCSCTQVDTRFWYNHGRAYYDSGELNKAVSCYVKCLSNKRPEYYDVIGCTYADLAMICHNGGNHKMAYEINKHSVDFYKYAELSQEYNSAMCRSAVYLAYCGERDEAITLFHYLCAIAKDNHVKDTANMYSHMLQKGQLPVLEGLPQASAIELYNAIGTIKYELYRKPFRNRVIFVIVIFILGFGIFYLAHNNVLQNLSDLRKEKKKYNEQQVSNIKQYCESLCEHPEELKKELHWSDFKKMRSIVNLRMGGLIEKIEQMAKFNETEIRLCVLVIVGLPRNLIAEILPYASNSIGKLKNTVSKKFGTNGKNLHDLLIKIALNDEF